MKMNSVLMIAAAALLSSCGTAAHQASSDSGYRFQDGIYCSVPDFMTKEEKEAGKAETDALVEETRNSEIYLLGEKKDTVMIPENMSAVIRYDQKLGGTVVTVGENPYSWRYDLENNHGYYYGPYSIGSSWYWSRHYNHWYWNSWTYTPWRYYGWYDPMYTYGWYDPWYYGGWHDPWYYGWGYSPWYGYPPYYCGWYGGWDPHHHHHGHHDTPGGHEGNGRWHGLRAQTGSDRVFTSGNATARGGFTRTPLTRKVSQNTSSASRTVSTGRNTGSGRVATVSRTAVRTNLPKPQQSISNHRKPTVATHSERTHMGPASGTLSGQTYNRTSSVKNGAYQTDRNDSGKSFSRTPVNSHDRGNTPSYDRSSTPSYDRSSTPSYNRGGGSSSGFSRSAPSSGGGFSRSGGSAGPRR